MRVRFPVRPETARELYDRMERLEVYEEDLEETFIRASGRGGQKVNKTSSGVHLRHRPTGIEVKYTRERSQPLNRFLARRLLVDRIEAGEKGISSSAAAEAARIRKQKKRRRARSGIVKQG